jgi:hypothetical protein
MAGSRLRRAGGRSAIGLIQFRREEGTRAVRPRAPMGRARQGAFDRLRIGSRGWYSLVVRYSLLLGFPSVCTSRPLADNRHVRWDVCMRKDDLI